MKRTVKLFRKTAVLLVGIPLFLLGIILIPLPGPGVLVTFLSLVVLSFEFEWARKRRASVQLVLKKIIDDALKQYREEKLRHDQEKNQHK